MADLRTFSTAEEAAEHILTKGPNGELQDGHGVDLRLRTTTHTISNPSLLIDDDTLATIPTGGNNNLVVVLNVQVGGLITSVIIGCRTGSLNAVEILTQSTWASNNIEVATGVPTGTTGTDGKMTLFVGSNAIYIENRSGNSRFVRLTIID